MQKSKIADWLELTAAVAVVAGLLLVAMELRQSNQHATAESNREIYQEWSEIYRYESEYEIDLLIAKAIARPDDLTDSELYRLDDYYSIVMNAYFVRSMMQDSGLLAGNEVQNEAVFIVDTFFYYPVAREWLELVDQWVQLRAPNLHVALVAAAETTPMVDSPDWQKGWKSVYPLD